MTTPDLARCEDACQTDALTRETIYTGPYSVVERLTLPDGTTAVLKRTDARLFPLEPAALAAAARAGAPVPDLYATCTHADTTHLLMQDVGPAHRTAEPSDVAYAAARLHRYAAHVRQGDLLDEAGLTDLPARGARAVQRIPAEHPGSLAAIRRLLARIAEQAVERAAGAHLPPFGLCHGELHPSAVHLGTGGVVLLDLAVAHTGPGLLDLAAFFGSTTRPDPAAMRHLIHQYVEAGGRPSTAAPRGGLAAEAWALGWHRVHAAIWHLEHHRTAADLSKARLQLTGALHFWTVTSPDT